MAVPSYAVHDMLVSCLGVEGGQKERGRAIRLTVARTMVRSSHQKERTIHIRVMTRRTVMMTTRALRLARMPMMDGPQWPLY